MKKSSIEFQITEYENIAEVPEKAGEFLVMAERAQEKAYAPYSNFKVGAVVVLSNGAVYTGNNQENAAFPSGLCAERVAIFKAGADNPGVAVSAVYISCDDQSGICAPCGSCRQALMEYESKQEFPIQIWIPGGDGKFIMLEAVKDLLPFPFSLNK